jgi:hypothetical protein
LTDNAAAGSVAVQRRRESRREKLSEQTELAELLAKYLPAGVFSSGLKNKPLSRLSGFLQKQRGITSGLPDVLVLYRGKTWS